MAYQGIPGFVFFGLYLMRRKLLLFFGGLYMTALTVEIEAFKPLAAFLL